MKKVFILLFSAFLIFVISIPVLASDAVGGTVDNELPFDSEFSSDAWNGNSEFITSDSSESFFIPFFSFIGSIGHSLLFFCNPFTYLFFGFFILGLLCLVIYLFLGGHDRRYRRR